MIYRRLSLHDRIFRTKIYEPGVNKVLLKRLNWEQIEARPPKEGHNVVKGTSKRIVVVKSPDPKIFEQAFFIVREDFLRGGAGRANALKEAEKVADDYIRSAVLKPKSFFSRIPVPIWAGLGLIVSLITAFVLTKII